MTDDELGAAHANSRAGTALLAAGLFGLVVCLVGIAWALPAPLQRMFSRAPLFWMGGVLGLFGSGLTVLWKANHGGTHWRPGRRTTRFESAVLYTRKDCPLCDDARELLHLYRRWLPPIREIDIDIHPDFRDAFSTCVPVLEIDDQVRFRGKISAVLLRRLIQGNSTSDVASAS